MARSSWSLLSWLACVLVALAIFAPVGCATSGGAGDTSDGGSATGADSGANGPSSLGGNTDNGAAPPQNNDAKVPVLTSVAPSTAVVGSVGPTVILTGENFVARTVVQLEGAPLATTFVSETELRATLATASLATTGVLHISAGTSPPGGGASAEIEFTVQNPVPQLTSLAPLSVLAGAPDTQVTLTGTGFAAGATVTLDGAPIASILQSDTALTITIPMAKLAVSATMNVAVTNPTPGGGASAPISFTVANPNVQVTSITPGSQYVGSAATPIAIVGSGFVAATQVLFNGNPITTAYVDAAHVNATIPSTALMTVGSLPVAVKNPPPGGGVSAPISFSVQYPAPTATSLAPAQTNAGAAPTLVTVTGSGFFPASQVMFDGAAAATTYVDGAHVSATLTAVQLATAGTISVTVSNPAPGGGSSGAVTFTVDNPAPSITSLAPSTIAIGSADTVVTVNGTGFVASSIVMSNGGNLATTYVSAAQLKATVPAAQLSSPGSLAITVKNGAPGGGTSAAAMLSVGCNTTGVDVQLGAVGNVTTIPTSFATASASGHFLESGSCPTTVFASVALPIRSWVVQNTSGAAVTLAAWAVCSADATQDDAVLSIYSGATVPSGDSGREACTGYASEGADGAISLASPEAGPSAWCPGLTKANGGGLLLGVCGTAVVQIQPYSMTSTTYTPPPQIKLEPE